MKSYCGLDCFIAGASADRICYILLPDGLKEDVLDFMGTFTQEAGLTVAAVTGMDWNNDLTPWPGLPVFKSGKGFGGNADEFLQKLVSQLIPSLEHDLGMASPRRYLAGISLSGLFALWAAHRCGSFHGIASISGSFWYEDFAEWICRHELNGSVEKVHISLGNREKNTRNPHMREVESMTESIVNHLESQSCSVDYALVDATHFSPVIPRLRLALEGLLK